MDTKESTEASTDIDPLQKGRGKRPKLNHLSLSLRMSSKTKHELECLAKDYGCMYAGKPWITGLLTKIANRELLVVPPTYLRPLVEHSSNLSK